MTLILTGFVGAHVLCIVWVARVLKAQSQRHGGMLPAKSFR